MGCLLFKESKLNFLENLKTEGYINSGRELTFEKDIHKYLNDLVNRLNLNYDLNLKSLATIKEVKIKNGKDFSRDSEKFILTPIEESFEQIDNRRKELGIYEDRISIGEYNKTQSEKISNQEEINLNSFNGGETLLGQEEKKNKYYQVNDETIKKIEEPKSIDDLFNTLYSIENTINLITNSVLNNEWVSNYYLTQTNENRFKTVLEKEGISINQIDYITDFIKNNNLFNRKLSEIIGIINQEIILNSKGLNYYNAILKDKANEKLDGFLKDFLSSQLNVSVIDNMVNHYGSPMAVADILNKVIQINKKNLKTLPEETGHFFFELLGNQNALQKQLIDGVESWEGYQDVFNKYKTIYLKTNIKNEIVPDINKIKREAVGQAIGEGLIRNFKAKEGDSFFSSLQKAIDYIKKLFADLGIFNFNSVVDDIAKDILNNDISKIKQIKDEHYKKRTYKETLANNPEILEIIENIQKLGGTLTGSLAYRDQGDLYRPDDELVHDLDFRIYYDVYNGDIQNFIEKITKIYPDVEYRRKSNGEIMAWTDSNGHTSFLLRKGEILIDLFFYPEQIKNENNKFSNWYSAFVEKYKMGRPKDMNDILRWSNFKQQNLFDEVQPFVYYQLEEKENLVTDSDQAVNEVVKPGVEELFESNPELANEVYSKILTNSGISAENLLSLLEKENIVEKDCTGGGKLKAEKGLQTNFTKGGKWRLIKDLKGYPTHKEGGVDLTISKNGVSIKNGNTEFTAKHGLVIPKN